MNFLSEEVKQFVTRYIRSLGHLEVLLLLFRNPNRKFLTPEIVSELRTTTDYATKQLEELAELGLVSRCAESGCYYYSSSDDLDKVLDQVSMDFSRHRLAIIDLLYSQPIDKMRQFADAFKIKKD